MAHLSEKTLNAWVDGMLSGPEAERVEAHLSECPACRKAAAEIRLLVGALEALPQPSGAKSLARTTMAAWKKLTSAADIRVVRPVLTGWWRAVAYGAVAAGLMVGLLAGYAATTVIVPESNTESQVASNYIGGYDEGSDLYIQLLVADDGGGR